MPVFSFEKAARRRTAAPANTTGTEPRGIIIQLFDRIAEARMQRDAKSFCRMKRGAKPGRASGPLDQCR